MVNYANGKIYTIRSMSKPELIYVGSTASTLSRRFSDHKGAYKLKKYVASQELLKIGDAYIELHEMCPCKVKCELEKRETEVMREFMKQKDSIVVNCHVPDGVIKNDDYKTMPNNRSTRHQAKLFAKSLPYGRQWLINIKRDVNNMTDEDIVNEWTIEKERRFKIQSQKSDKHAVVCECGSTLYYGQKWDDNIGQYYHSSHGNDVHKEWLKKGIQRCDCGAMVKIQSAHIKPKSI